MSISKRFLNLRIRYRLILSYCISFILIFIAGGSLIHYQFSATMRKNLEFELQNKTNMILKLVKSSVSLSIKNHLRATAEKNLEMVTYFFHQYKKGLISEEEAKHRASELLLAQTVGKTGYLYVLDSKGIALVHPIKSVAGKQYTQFNFINQMIRMKNGFLEYSWQNPSEGKPYLKAQYFKYFEPWDWIIAATSYKSEFLHLVSIDDIKEAIYSIRVGKSGYSLIINSDAQTVIHPKIEGNLFDYSSEETRNVLSEIILKKSGTIDYSWQNPGDTELRKKIAIFNYIPEYDWIVMSTVYVDEFYQPLTNMKRIFALISLVSILISILISINLGRGITRPIEMLTDQLHSYASGKDLKRIDVPGTDETGQLASDFNRFMDRLEHEKVQRKTAERSLLESEEKFKAIFNSSHTFTGFLDLDGIVLEINQSSLDLIQVDASDVMGKPFWETPWWSVSEKAKDRLRNNIQQCAKGDFIRYEARHIDEKGKSLVVDFSLKRISDKTGKSFGIIAEGRDITEIKNTQEALRISEERHRAILEASPNPIILYDDIGKVIFVNQAFTRVFGWRLEEVTGAKMDFVPDENLEETMFAVNSIRKSKTRYSFETRRYTKAGSVLDVNINAAAVRSKENDYAGMVVNFTDITHIKATDRELRNARNYIRNIINSMPSALVGVDSRLRVTQWNLSAEHMTGILSTEARSKPLLDLIPQLDYQVSKIERAISRGSVEKASKIKLPGIQDERIFDMTIYPVVSMEEQGAVILINDITNRILMEELMIQSEKMVSVGGLAAGMAHEINNPLAGIMQNTQVMMSRLKDPLPKNSETARELGLELKDIQAYMEKRGIYALGEAIHNAGKRAAKIVENMLSFSRKSDHLVSSYDLRKLLDTTVDIAENDYALKKKYDFRAITIIREYADDMPLIPCEQSKIQQVFFNILQNGAQAMAKNNAAMKPDPTFWLRVKTEENHARIEIEDNGPGMDERILNRVFEPFFTTKDVWTGTGLGLSVSYFIITENHKGTITAESEPGKGTRFIIKLPLAGPGSSVNN